MHSGWMSVARLIDARFRAYSQGPHDTNKDQMTNKMTKHDTNEDQMTDKQTRHKRRPNDKQPNDNENKVGKKNQMHRN